MPIYLCRFILLGFFCAPAVFANGETSAEPSYLTTAQQAAAWLRHQGVDTPDGRIWPPNPDKPDELDANLYAGSAGVVLFFSELHRVLPKEGYGADAMAGGDALLAGIPQKLKEPTDAGLYTGIGGIGVVLAYLAEVTGEQRYRQGAMRCLDLTLERNQRADIAEAARVTDVVYGQAGVGLFLLHMARHYKRKDAINVARQIGDRFLGSAVKSDAGWSWPMEPSFPRIMPNFSHGTAGVAFFLAALHRVAGEAGYLQAALRGADLLLSLANEDGLVYHNRPRDTELYYLGWCHGPVGTTRLYEQLWRESGETRWRRHTLKAMSTVRNLGIEEKRTPGFWNNVGICCGSAGVCSRAVDMYRLDGGKDYLGFAERLAADILARSNHKQGRSWTHAEHRTQPENLSTQTGYMQGAAGIGLAFLELHLAKEGKSLAFQMPDRPFGKTRRP